VVLEQQGDDDVMVTGKCAAVTVRDLLVWAPDHDVSGAQVAAHRRGTLAHRHT
jgi:hypothetical protein